LDSSSLAHTDVSTPPTSVFDTEERVILDDPVKVRITQALHDIIEATQLLDVRGSSSLGPPLDSVLESVYFGLTNDQKETFYKFCHKVVDLHFDDELLTSFIGNEGLVSSEEGDQLTEYDRSETMYAAEVYPPLQQTEIESIHAGAIKAKEVSQGTTRNNESIFVVETTTNNLLETDRAGDRPSSLEGRDKSLQENTTGVRELCLPDRNTPKTELCQNSASTHRTPAIMNSQELVESRKSHAFTEKRLWTRPPSNIKKGACGHVLESKSIESFIQDAHTELAYFATSQADHTLSGLSVLWHEESSIDADGSTLLSVLDRAFEKTRLATLHYAFTAMHAAAWFNHRKSPPTDQGEGLVSPLEAGQILDLLTGPKPRESTEHSEWETKRKRCSTHLARGRKLLKLVQNLGRGILFTGIWSVL
jgi:hypothetical protein